MKNDNQEKISGNILLFYAFDLGDDIEIFSIKNKNLVLLYEKAPSPFFKNYHIPLSFKLTAEKNKETIERKDCIASKIYHFGVVSLCYKIPFESNFDDLRQKLIELKNEYDTQSNIDAKNVFKKIGPAIKKPHFYNLKSDYYAVQVNPIGKEASGKEFREKYGTKILPLLRLETKLLSEYQKNEILSSVTGYYGQDFIIIDSEASFIYDTEYNEPMEILELTNVQQLELHYYDWLLDNKLNYFYMQKSLTPPWTAYIPLIGQRFQQPASKLASLRVDISVITERLENSIKITGDAYFLQLYSMLVAKLGLKDWRESINRKLEIIWNLHQVHIDNLNSLHSEILELVIIILIALEAIIAFYH